MWQQVITQLLESGFTQTDLSRRIGSSQTYVSEIANGRLKEPSWSRGQAFLKIYRDTFAGRPGFIDPESWGI